jgi:hypothetical protein
LRKITGAAAIVFGTIAVGFSPLRWDTVVLDLPRGHGIHAHDLIGIALVVLGITVLWRSHVPGAYERAARLTEPSVAQLLAF